MIRAGGLVAEAAATLALAWLLNAATRETGVQVQTADGTLAGVQRHDARVFEGIPYAEPPVGDLRWRAPRSPRPWAGVRQVKRPANECVQQAVFWRPGSAASGPVATCVGI
jgi:para-nitrobenzyl esterase